MLRGGVLSFEEPGSPLIQASQAGKLMKHKNPDEGSFTFLLVEDDPAHAELVKRGFQEHGGAYKIIHLSDGEAALDYLFRRGLYADEHRSPRPHVVLLDLRLPRKSGFDVLEEVKAEPTLRDIPIVVLTTSQAREDAVRAYHLHANSFVVKPADFSKFSALVKELGQYWLRWNFCVKQPKARSSARPFRVKSPAFGL